MDQHGGNVHALARERGLPLHRIPDFSASINPLGPPPRARRAVMRAVDDLVHYPDPDGTVLREALAKHHGLTADRILVTNGSMEGIALVPQALRLSKVLVIGPTFSEYPRRWRLEGVRVHLLQATRATGYQPPIDRAVDLIRTAPNRFDAVVLCNPNSPTGQAVDVPDVMRLAAAINRRNGWALIDEAFIDYCGRHSVLPALDRYRHVVLIRSFTKFYALPGLRIGYVISNADLIRRLRERQHPWSVNALAHTAALASLQDDRYADRSRRFMEHERPRLVKALSALPGLRVYPSVANFLLLELPAPHTAGDVAEILRGQGLLIRDCSTIPGLTVRTARIAVRTPAENRRLVQALACILSSDVEK